VPKDFKSLLPKKFIHFLEGKLKSGEMTPEECQTVLKEVMLREYELKQAEQPYFDWQALARNFLNWSQSSLIQLLEKKPTEATISMEELAGTVRTRRV